MNTGVTTATADMESQNNRINDLMHKKDDQRHHHGGGDISNGAMKTVAKQAVKAAM